MKDVMEKAAQLEFKLRQPLWDLAGSETFSAEFFDLMVRRVAWAITTGTLNDLTSDAVMFNPDYPGELDVVPEANVESWVRKHKIVDFVREYNPNAVMKLDQLKEKFICRKSEMDEILKPYCDDAYKRSCIVALVESGIKVKMSYAFGLIMPPIKHDEMADLFEKSGLKAYIEKEIKEEK